MRKVFSVLLIVIGLICCAISIYPIFEMNQQVNESLNEWEEIKNQEPSEEKAPLEEGLIGILKISSYEDLIPIRLGTTELILKKGIGVDETTVLPGEVGNSVLYGHREKILWNLKDVKLGDEIKIETLDAELTFIINDIQVLDPDDEYIYETAEEATITLVTCYPFIYMGPTPERYVVKAVLQN